jgi:hypothetical protein
LAVLDEFLHLKAIDGAGSLEALALIRSYTQAVIGVNSARRPNLGLMADPDFRAQLKPAPRRKSWTDVRLADYQLGQRGLPANRAPRDASRAPLAMQRGFALFAALAEDGYSEQLAGEAEDQPLKLCLETNSQVTFALVLQRVAEPRNRFSGRLQRQLALRTEKVDIPDPMRIFEEFTRHRILQGRLPIDDLLTAGQLDAVAAALAVWRAYKNPAQTLLLGDPNEGQVMIPAASLDLANTHAAL